MASRICKLGLLLQKNTANHMKGQLTGFPLRLINLKSLCRNTSSNSSNPQNPTDSDSDSEMPDLQLYVTEKKLKSDGVIPGRGAPPEMPIGCCGSGCANCVWIDYAEQMAKYYGELGQQQAMDAISAEIEDPSLKAFLMLEMKFMKFSKS